LFEDFDADLLFSQRHHFEGKNLLWRNEFPKKLIWVFTPYRHQSTMSKAQFDALSHRLLEVCMSVEGIKDGEWKSVCDDTMGMRRAYEDLYGRHTRLVKEMLDLQDKINENKYYRKYVKEGKPVLTARASAEEKAQNKEYTTCPICQRVVKRTQLNEHQTITKVCVEIRMTKGLVKRLKTTQLPAFVETKKIAPLNWFLHQKAETDRQYTQGGYMNWLIKGDPRPEGLIYDKGEWRTAVPLNRASASP